MRPKALLFDLDGTLLDSVSNILKANRETFDLMKLRLSDEDSRNAIGIPLEVQARRFAGDRAEEFIETYRQVFRKYADNEARLFPGAVEALDRVRSRGCLTALVTSKNSRATQRVLGKSGLDGRFDVVITADDVTNPKPHPEPILKALEVLDVRPGEAVFVGDSLFDVEASNLAGVRMIGVSWGAKTREELMAGSVAAAADTWEELVTWLDAEPQPWQ